MSVRWAGFTAPFRWLIDAVDVGRHQPAAVLGAVLLATLINMMPNFLQQLATLAGAGGGVLIGVTQAAGMLLAILIAPVLLGGIFRLFSAAEQGQTVAATDILAGFKDGSFSRLVLTNLLFFALMFAVVLMMLVVIAIIVPMSAIQALQPWMEQIMALQAQAGAGKPIQPNELPLPPEGLGAIMGVMLAFTPLLLLVSIGGMWAVAQSALRGDGPVASVLLGMRAAFANAPSLLVLILALAIAGSLLGTLAVLLIGGLIALLSLASPALGAAAGMLILVLITVLLNAVAYSFHLAGWHATCDGGSMPTPAERSDTTGFEA
jgi:hypothetical protein